MSSLFEWNRNDVAFQGYSVAKSKALNPYKIKMIERAADRQWTVYLDIVQKQFEHEKTLKDEALRYIARLQKRNVIATAYILKSIFREMQTPETVRELKRAAVQRLREILNVRK